MNNLFIKYHYKKWASIIHITIIFHLSQEVVFDSKYNSVPIYNKEVKNLFLPEILKVSFAKEIAQFFYQKTDKFFIKSVYCFKVHLNAPPQWEE